MQIRGYILFCFIIYQYLYDKSQLFVEDLIELIFQIIDSIRQNKTIYTLEILKFLFVNLPG